MGLVGTARGCCFYSDFCNSYYFCCHYYHYHYYVDFGLLNCSADSRFPETPSARVMSPEAQTFRSLAGRRPPQHASARAHPAAQQSPLGFRVYGYRFGGFGKSVHGTRQKQILNGGEPDRYVCTLGSPSQQSPLHQADILPVDLRRSSKVAPNPLRLLHLPSCHAVQLSGSPLKTWA